MYKQNPGDPKKKLNTPGTFREDSTFMKLAKDGSNSLFKVDSGLYKNGKDKDDFNYESDMGKYNPTITAYEGDAWVGKKGGNAQKTGTEVSGLTEGTRGDDGETVRGRVTGPAKSTKSEQSRRVKGGTYSS